MGHNRRGKGETWKLGSWRTCVHCEVHGDSLGHISTRCGCGAEGAYCTAHDRVDWGEYAKMSCAEVRRMLAGEKEDAKIMEQEAERQDREEQAEERGKA